MGDDAAMLSGPRLLPLAGAFNFRDLGGYPTREGGTTRWGQIFRSDTLHELTDGDLELLRNLGLSLTIDLRSAAEVQLTGRGLMGAEPIAYLHLSVLQDVPSTNEGPSSLASLDLSDLYLRWLDTGRPALVQALKAMGSPSNYPLVFHCAAGKDRTGVLAALVLAVLGVERHVIVEDYVLTASRLHLIRSRQRQNHETAKRMAEAPQLFDVEAATMERFLDGLYERYGGAGEWARAAGVPAKALNTMCERLVTR